MTTGTMAAGDVGLESLIELMVVDPRTAIVTAVRLGLFTALADGPRTAAELCAEAGLAPRPAADFLDALTGLHLLTKDGTRYRNTALADTYLVSTRPAYMGEFLDQITESAHAAWGQLGAALRDEPVHTQLRGGFAGGMNPDPDRARRFMATMDELNGRIALRLAERLDWSQHSTFADLGGARGNLAAMLVAAHPHLRGICVELPHGEPFFDEHMAELGLRDQVSFAPVNLFVDRLPSADVLVYGQVLHGYHDQDRRVLLARAAEVLPPDGELVIYDRMIGDEERDVNRLLYSLYMRLVSPTGSEYRSADCVAWLSELGFDSVIVEPLLTTHTLVIARR